MIATIKNQNKNLIIIFNLLKIITMFRGKLKLSRVSRSTIIIGTKIWIYTNNNINLNVFSSFLKFYLFGLGKTKLFFMVRTGILILSFNKNIGKLTSFHVLGGRDE